jgi:hypothetical protein
VAQTLHALTTHVYDYHPWKAGTDPSWTGRITKPQKETVRLILKRFVKDGCEPYAPIRVEPVGKGVKGDPTRWIGIVK